MNKINIGDFIIYKDCTREAYPGRVIKIQDNGKVVIEICTNKRKNNNNDTEIIKCSTSQISICK